MPLNSISNWCFKIFICIIQLFVGKNGSPPSESYPSSFDAEFWLENRFCSVGIIEGKMDPLGTSASSRLPSLSTDRNGFGPQIKVLRLGWRSRHHQRRPHRQENSHHHQRGFPATSPKTRQQNCPRWRWARQTNLTSPMPRVPSHGCSQ